MPGNPESVAPGDARRKTGAPRASSFLVVRLLLLLIAVSAFPATAAPLQARWEFRMLPGDAQGAAHPGLQQWRAAKVPGSVHTDLLAHG